MTVVVDAGILAALMLPQACSRSVRTKMRFWAAADETLIAPFLLNYEVTSIFRKSVAQGLLTTEEAAIAACQVLNAGIHWVPPSEALNRRALEWAERLCQWVAYDAAYLAVAESERAELWTTDRRLSNAAGQLGVDWVHFAGE